MEDLYFKSKIVKVILGLAEREEKWGKTIQSNNLTTRKGER